MFFIASIVILGKTERRRARLFLTWRVLILGWSQAAEVSPWLGKWETGREEERVGLEFMAGGQGRLCEAKPTELTVLNIHHPRMEPGDRLIRPADQAREA